MPKSAVFHTRYNRPQHEGVFFTEPTMTQQHMKDECDINLIISRAIRSGDTTVFTTDQRAAFYDCTNTTDFCDALEFIRSVELDFKSLPAETRRFFGDNMDAYFAFINDPKNHDHCVKLGLFEGRATESANPLPVSTTVEPPVGAPKTTETD